MTTSSRIHERIAMFSWVLLLAGATRVDSSIAFEEVSAPWGISFRHRHGGTGDFNLIETMGSGVVIFDFDHDGDEDVLFVQSGDLPLAGTTVRTNSVLYRNDGGGWFVDFTDAAGIVLPIYGMGATAGDVDSDGDVDLYVTAFGANRLLQNNDDGTFSDVSLSSGTADGAWGASAAFADPDLDGDLDLYVTNYVDFSFDNNPTCGIQERGLRTYCNPEPYNGLPDRFFRNRGDGSFEDATAAAGFKRADGKGLGVIFGDIDRDGWPDLYVANDLTANFLFRNTGHGIFEEVALISGTAFDEKGNAEAGMGVELGDIDDNGFPDIIVTHVDEQTNALYANTGVGIFIDRRWPAQFAEPSYFSVGFGVVLIDIEHDGDLDVVVANGHIAHNADEWGTGTTFKQKNLVLENLGGGRFREITDAGVNVILASRGLAAGDLDRDGDLDMVVSNSDDPAEVYENVSDPRGSWLQVDSASPAAAIGTQIEVLLGGRRQQREIRTGSSYLSQNALSAHLGLGAARVIDRLEIRWPRGTRQHFHDLPVNRRVQLYPPLAE